MWARSADPQYDSSEHKRESEPDGVYHNTCSHIDQIPPVDYDRLDAEAFRPSKCHSAIAEF